MSSTLLTRGPVPEKRKITTKPRPSDIVFRGVLTLMSMSSLLILTLIGLFLSIRGFQAFQTQGLGFITKVDWTAGVDGGKDTFGLGAMIIGTLVISAIALVIGVPLSVLTALFLTFYAPERIKKALVTLVDLMASFPSILFGLWGFIVLMPMAEYWAKLIHKYLDWIPVFSMPSPAFTRSPFIAGVVLAIMIIPIVTSVSREIFGQTPLDRIQAAYALGATRWAMIKAVVLPFGASGVVGGAMLGLGRALGETVAVYSVLNIVFKVNFHVLYGFGGNIASMIVGKWGEASLTESKALLAAGFVLFVMTLLVNLLANYIVRKTVKTGK
ncbi:MAG: phosphate ABC transporter permease subunit PstC [Actinobacteria bacterium]|nr:phosphate ABC transporter permease subunit PstC [Actinomycetota bacterium]